jgi:hypothetical protein
MARVFHLHFDVYSDFFPAATHRAVNRKIPAFVTNPACSFNYFFNGY